MFAQIIKIQFTPLAIAMENRAFEVAQYLIDQGANVNVKDRVQYTYGSITIWCLAVFFVS